MIHDSDQAQAVELIRALRDQLKEMTAQLAWVERREVTSMSGPARARTSEAVLRRDIAAAEMHIDRLYRRYGNRLAPAPQDAAAAPAASIRAKEKAAPVEKTTKVKCNKCHHIQPVPQDLAVFACDECGARLKRRTATAEDH